jgi:hypothetical protein
MEYDCIYNAKNNTIETTTHGLAKADVFIKMVRSIIEECKQHEIANLIVDHTDLDSSPLTIDNIETVKKITISFKSILNNRKIAFVVSRDLELGLIRAWDNMIEWSGGTAIETKIFKKREDALKWVK